MSNGPAVVHCTTPADTGRSLRGNTMNTLRIIAIGLLLCAAAFHAPAHSPRRIFDLRAQTATPPAEKAPPPLLPRTVASNATVPS